MEGLRVEDDPINQRYAAKLGGKVVGYAEYRPITGAVMFTHTEVDEDMEGQGVGSKLVRAALEDVKARGLMVIPMCPFVAAFIQRHKGEYVDLVHPAHRGIFGL